MKRPGKILLSILSTVVVLAGGVAIANVINTGNLLNYAKSFDKVIIENQLTPTYNEELDCYSFTTDEDFKVLQLTDVHVGGGFMSNSKDKKALNAVASMITYEKPDLVVITGDLVFPVPYEAGTFNNRNPHNVVINLLETLGVYYTVVFGNHDAEAYNYHSRHNVADWYMDENLKYCLFNRGPKDIFGECNHYITVQNSSGYITQTFFMIDSNDYLDDDPIGLKWHYDNVHEDQIAWYKESVLKLKAHNKTKGKEEIKSMIFQHIPIEQMKTAFDDAWNKDQNKFIDTTDTKYNFGVAGEGGQVVYPPEDSGTYFDTILELDSTKAMFFGHDHLNNFSLTYKGVQLTYGLSIDYLAYGADRGCTVINVNTDSTFTIHQESYYQDKYKVKDGIDKKD